MSIFLMGVDLAQTQNYTAIVIAELVERTAERCCYHIRHAERLALGISYPQIVEHVRHLLRDPKLARRSRLVVDATGVGKPVIDLMRHARLNPIAVTITAGMAVVQSDLTSYSVPKRDLASTLQVLLQAGRLQIAREMPQSELLVDELLNFRVKINLSTAHDSYEAWRESQHDDLVLATALACWWGEKAWRGPRPRVVVKWGS